MDDFLCDFSDFLFGVFRVGGVVCIFVVVRLRFLTGALHNDKNGSCDIARQISWTRIASNALWHAGGCGARAVSLASQKSEARGEWRSERSERAKLTSPPRRPRVSGARKRFLRTKCVVNCYPSAFRRNAQTA